jgi:hypothetical protein
MKIKKVLIFVFVFIMLAGFIFAGCNIKQKELVSVCSDLVHANFVKIISNYAYFSYVILCGGDVVESGLKIADIKDKDDIKVVGTVKTSGWANGIFIEGDYAYIANGNNGLKIVDIRDKNKPKIISSLDTPGFANSIAKYGNFIYIAAGEDGIHVINTSNKEKPYLVNTIETSGYASDVFAENGFLYVADGDGGLQVFSLSN